MTIDATLAALRDLLGPGGVLEAEDDIAPYLVDFRRLHRGRTPLVCRPSRVADVATIVRLCHAARIGIVPHGGNTSYCGGATPDATGHQVVLSLARLKRIRAVDAEGNALHVDAGVTLAAAQAAAAGAGRRLALSLGSEGTCQIGGNLSTNAGGTSVLRFGMARDLVLGLEVVLPDGRVLDQMRSLRKDNTGYDVKQLFLGAEGTLGVITGACLKLAAQPADFATAYVALEDLDAAVALLGRLRGAFGDLVEAFEFLPRIALELASRHVPGALAPFADRPAAAALVELAVPAALGSVAGAFQEFLAGEIGTGGVLDAALAQSGAQREAFWFLREHVPEAQTREGASIKHDVSLPIACLGEFVRRATAELAALAPGARIVGYGHVGDGNLHFNLSPPPGTGRGSPEEAAFLAREPTVRRAVHDLVAAFAGSFSAEHGIGQLKVGELERYEDPVALELMRRLKATIDPHGVMNPGKVLRA